MNIKDRFSSSWIGAAAGGMVLGSLAGFLLSAPVAEANLFQDLLRNFIGPQVSQPMGEPVLTVPEPEEAQKTQIEIPLFEPVQDYERAVIAAVKKASPAVVSVTVSKNVPIIENCPADPFADLPPEFRRFFGDDLPQFSEPCEQGTRIQEVGGGSGFIISSDGLILTNKHVVSDVSASYTVFTNDGKKYNATVLARDPLQDLAIMKISATGLPTVELGNSDALELGQTAIAIGNALGEFRNTVSVGAISGLARTVRASGGGVTEVIQNVIQTDAAINPGNSGGPLLDLAGRVVGINTAVVSGAQNIGFAIPINTAKKDIDSVRRTGSIELPFLGVRYTMITPALSESRGLPVAYGAIVESRTGEAAITAGSPAAQAGLKAGDIILEMNGERLTEDNPLGNAIAKREVGDRVALRVYRAGETLALSAVLAKRP